MLADFLQDKQFFGASRLVFSSASSKTAYGTAVCLDNHPGLERVALEVVESKGYEAAQTLISRLFHGQVAPVEGHVILL